MPTLTRSPGRLAASLAVVILAGCATTVPAPSGAPSAAGPSSAPSAAGPSSAAASAHATPAPSPDASATGATVWLPDWADGSTPRAVRERTPLPLCGVERAPEPQPMEYIDEVVRGCFWEAARAGRPAEWVSIQGTMEGAAIATIYRLPGDGTVEVLSDFTQDPLGSGGWFRTVCNEVVEGEGESLVGVADCAEAVPLP